MLKRKSISDDFENFDRDFDKQFSTLKKTAKKGFIGGGVGFIVGAVGGVWLGESINDYVEFLKQAPIAIQYAVDFGSAVGCGGIGAGIGASLAQAKGLYKLLKEF